MPVIIATCPEGRQNVCTVNASTGAVRRKKTAREESYFDVAAIASQDPSESLSVH